MRSPHPLVFVDTGRGQFRCILSSFEFSPVSVLKCSKCTQYFMLSARIYPQPYSSKYHLSLLSSVPSTDLDLESLVLPRNTRIGTVQPPPTQPFIDVITDATPTPSYISTLRSSSSTYPRVRFGVHAPALSPRQLSNSGDLLINSNTIPVLSCSHSRRAAGRVT